MVQKRRRHSVRLRGYNYSSPGDYFVTICTFQRECFLCDIERSRVKPTVFGTIVQKCWHSLPSHYSHVTLGTFIVMPNHVHGIITLSQKDSDIPRHGISEMVRWFKGMATKHINRVRGIEGEHVWQRGFYDDIIRTPQEYAAINHYILENPLRWTLDSLHPAHPNPFPINDE